MEVDDLLVTAIQDVCLITHELETRHSRQHRLNVYAPEVHEEYDLNHTDTDVRYYYFYYRKTNLLCELRIFLIELLVANSQRIPSVFMSDLII